MLARLRRGLAMVVTALAVLSLLGASTSWAATRHGRERARVEHRVEKRKKTGTKSRAAKTKANPLARYLSVDAAAHAVTLTLIGGLGSAGGGLNFNGTVDGRMVVSVPKGWRVTVDFKNEGSLNHSAAIVANARSTKPAFPGASTPNPTVGQATGQSATFSFVASRVGTYRIACLVPGHEDAGMWAAFRVLPKGLPSIALK
jgi:uncharacterized cupredoxin-like copper-binding protein